jgi:hypothetical protein
MNQTSPSRAPRLAVAPRVARAVGAIAVLVVGGVHLEQYTAAYFSSIPTIGSLFLANFAGATALGLILLVPMGPAPGFPRLVVDAVAALAAVGLAAGAFAGLLISEHTPLFGFMEHGYRLEIVLALAAEAITVAALAVFLTAAAARLRALGDTSWRPRRAARG